MHKNKNKILAKAAMQGQARMGRVVGKANAQAVGGIRGGKPFARIGGSAAVRRKPVAPGGGGPGGVRRKPLPLGPGGGRPGAGVRRNDRCGRWSQECSALTCLQGSEERALAGARCAAMHNAY